MLELDFKFDLLGAWILALLIGLGIRLLVTDVVGLQVLVLDLDRHEELDAAAVLRLVSGDEGRLLARRVDVTVCLLRRLTLL